MGALFSADGVIYKACSYLSVFFFANILWIVFSLPIFTIGASTTALFNVMSKLTNDEDISVFKDFWKSYKLNFKQGSLIGIILIILFSVLYLDLTHLSLFNNMAVKFVAGGFQIFILVELVVCSTYVFYMLAKYHMTYKNLIKSAFILANKHLLTSFFCILIFLGITVVYVFILGSRTFILFTFASIYAFGTSFFIKSIVNKYIPDDKKKSKTLKTFSLR